MLSSQRFKIFCSCNFSLICITNVFLWIIIISICTYLSLPLFLKKIYLFLAVLGLCCCTRAFSSCGERGLRFVVVWGLLIAVASLVEHGLQACGLQQLWHAGSVVVARGLQNTGSVIVAHGPSCSAACGIFPDQSSNSSPLHWQADS